MPGGSGSSAPIRLARLDRWKDVVELCGLVEFAVLSHDAIPTQPPASLAAVIRLTVLQAPPVHVSSTALREALRRGDSPRTGLPLEVARHIDERLPLPSLTMSALKKKTTKKTPARPVAKSKAKAKGGASAKAGKPAARRILPAVPPLKAKSRGEKAAAKPMVVLPKLPAHLVAAIRALDDKKAVEIRVLEMGQISSVADFLVIATGTSEPHLRALRIALEQALDEVGVTSRSESQRDSGWTVVDAFDVLFHVFREDIRKSYALEALWKDGLDIPVSAILKA
jgi:ribosome-associated protein